jgi:hypothetical protein
MGEKGNVADVRTAGGHVATATQAGTRAQDLGLGGQALSSSAPPASQGGGGLLSDLADTAKDKATDIGLGGRGGAAGIVGGKKDDDEDDDES